MLQFGNSSVAVANTSDEAFLAALKWRPSDTALLSKQDQRADLKTIGMCWKNLLAKQDESTRPARLLSLDWCIAEGHWSCPEVIGVLRGKSKKAAKADLPERLRGWLNDELLTASPAGLLACCEILLCHAQALPAETIGQVWRVALSGAMQHATGWLTDDVSSADPEEMPQDSPLAGIMDGLLPWICGILFDDVSGAPKLAKVGKKALQQQLLQGTDDNGAPIAQVVRDLSGWISVWSDAIAAAAILGHDLWKDSEDRRFVGCLKAALTLLPQTQKFTGSRSSEIKGSALLKLAASVVEFDQSEPWWQSLIGHPPKLPVPKPAKSGDKSTDKPVEDTAKKVPFPGWQSDDAQVACLRSDWREDASLATVLYDEPVMSLELVADGVPLLSGAWQVNVINGGEPVSATKAWECCCWYSDEDLDYAEWSLDVGNGLKLGRQLLLSRRKQFAILADLVCEGSPDRIELETSLTLAADVTTQPADDSRELGLLTSGKCAIRAFPLILPQDRGLGATGQFQTDANDVRTLKLSCVSAHRGVYSPIVLDWSRKRRHDDVEWRTLTITQAGEVAPAAARGFRIRVGKHQLMLYRSLRPSGRYRSVLGHQTWQETVIANVTRTGDIVPILLVDM